MARPGSCRKPPSALYVESGRKSAFFLPFAFGVDEQKLLEAVTRHARRCQRPRRTAMSLRMHLGTGDSSSSSSLAGSNAVESAATLLEFVAALHAPKHGPGNTHHSQFGMTGHCLSWLGLRTTLRRRPGWGDGSVHAPWDPSACRSCRTRRRPINSRGPGQGPPLVGIAVGGRATIQRRTQPGQLAVRQPGRAPRSGHRSWRLLR